MILEMMAILAQGEDNSVPQLRGIAEIIALFPLRKTVQEMLHSEDPILSVSHIRRIA
jgi:hypothetical protein